MIIQVLRNYSLTGRKKNKCQKQFINFDTENHFFGYDAKLNAVKLLYYDRKNVFSFKKKKLRWFLNFDYSIYHFFPVSNKISPVARKLLIIQKSFPRRNTVSAR